MPINTVVFDAYGTLLDVDAAARAAAAEGQHPILAEIWPALSRDWRAKQLEYSWLRAITGAYCDFWQITQDALDWALERQGVEDNALRTRLLALYRDLAPFADATPCLSALRARGFATGILSNGDPEMLATACDSAGITPLCDHIISVQDAGIFKPSAKVYDLVEARFGVPRSEVLFVSANGWDAGCAADYGMQTVWVNRASAPVDRLPGRPRDVVRELTAVAALPDLAALPAPEVVTKASAVRFMTTDDGLRIAYDEAGTGLPVICLAGLTRNMRDFDFVRPELVKRCRVIRMDYRGRGRSDRDANYRNYTVQREASDVIELMDHLGLQRAAILGTSRGGLIGMSLAGNHKDRLLGVCLNDIGPIIGAEGLAYIFSHLGIIPKHRNYDEAADALVQIHAKRFPGVDRARWRRQAQILWTEEPEGLGLRYDAKLRRIFMEQSASDTLPDLWLMFEALRGLPVALIRGANSDILAAETAAEMRRRRPDMAYAEVPNRGHVPFLDEPEALGLIDRFLASLTLSAQPDTTPA